MNTGIIKTILLVEKQGNSSASSTASCKKDLEMLGYRVATAETGEMAIQMADSGADIDLILMDIDLGNGMDGVQAAEQMLKKHDLPIIFTFLNEEPQWVEKTQSILCYGYFSKSSNVKVLDATIKMALKLHMTHVKEKNRAEDFAFQAAILDKIGDHVTATDLDGRIVFVNEAECKAIGKKREEIIGKTTEVFGEDPKHGATQKEILKATLEEGSWRGDVVNFDSENNRIIMDCRTWIMRDSRGTADILIGIASNITERKHFEEALKASEEHLSATLRSIDDGVIACDKEGKVSYLNIAAESLTGWKSMEAVGVAVERVFNIINAQSREHVENPVRRAMKEGISVDLANHTMLISRNGEEYQIADCCAPIRDVSGAVTGAVLVFRDVTEEYKRRQELRESQEMYHSLFNQSTLGIYLHDLEGRMIDVNHMACVQSGYSREEWLGLTVFDAHPSQSTMNLPKAEILQAWSLWEPGKRLTIESEHQRKDGTVYPVEISTGLVRYGNKSAILAIVKDISERKKYEAELFIESTRRSMLMEQSRDGIVILDQNGKVVEANKSFADMIGYPLEQMSQLCVFDWEFQYPHEQIMDMIQNVDQKGDHFETKHRRKDGSVYDVEISTNAEWFGEQKLIFCVCRDITERKKFEEALDHSNSLMKYIIEHTRSAIAVHDRELNYLYVSQRYIDEYNVKEEDIIGKHHYDVFPDLPRKWRDVHQKALAGEILSAEDDRYEREDGSVEWTRWECRPWYEKEGSIGGIIVYTEIITERKRMEEALQKSENLFRKVFEILPVGLWIADKHGRLMQGNPAGVAIWGDEPKVAPDDYGVFKARRMLSGEEIAPDDWALAHTVKNGVTIVDELLEIDTFDGKKKIILNYTAPVLNEQGDVEAAIVVNQDITSRYYAEETLQSNYTLLQIAGETSAFGGWSVDLEKNICIWSDVVADIHDMPRGYSPPVEEGINFYAPEWREKISQVFSACAEKGIPYDEEMQIVTLTGKRVWVRTVGKAVKDENGKIIKVQGSFQDITERKRGENALKKSIKEKEVLLSEIHHRVKNNMAIISSLITLQTDYADRKKTPEKVLRDIKTRIESMALVHEMVHEHQNFAEIHAGKLLKRISDHLKRIYQIKDLKVTVQIRADDLRLDMNKSVPFTLLVSEILTNAFKHAFADRKSGLIEINLGKENGGYRLVVQDNGVGVSDMEQLQNTESFGYTIIQGLAKQLRADLEVVSSPGGGLRVEAQFPEKLLHT